MKGNYFPLKKHAVLEQFGFAHINDRQNRQIKVCVKSYKGLYYIYYVL